MGRHYFYNKYCEWPVGNPASSKLYTFIIKLVLRSFRYKNYKVINQIIRGSIEFFSIYF
jgi:hypothetical protein